MNNIGWFRLNVWCGDYDGYCSCMFWMYWGKGCRIAYVKWIAQKQDIKSLIILIMSYNAPIKPGLSSLTYPSWSRDFFLLNLTGGLLKSGLWCWSSTKFVWISGTRSSCQYESSWFSWYLFHLIIDLYSSGRHWILSALSFVEKQATVLNI